MWSLNFTFQSERCDLSTKGGEEVAVLNMTTFRALEEMQKWPSIRLEGLLDASRMPNKNSLFKSPKRQRESTIDIILYGQRHLAEQVAAKLCQADLFLEDPHFTPDAMPYENPQDLDIPDLPRSQDIGLAHMSQQTEPLFDGDPMDLVFDAPDLELDQIMDQLACHDYLDQARADGRIISNLLT
jgi:hypothetical protein